MPNRIVREGILTSERVASLGWADEVFYRRLLSVVDDFGRFYATPTLLRAACYPLQLDKVSDADVGKWTRCAEKAGLVSVYSAQDGKRYLQVHDFRQRTRAKVSKFPAPDMRLSDRRPSHDGHVSDRRPSHAHGDGDEHQTQEQEPPIKAKVLRLPT